MGSGLWKVRIQEAKNNFELESSSEGEVLWGHDGVWADDIRLYDA